MYNSSVQLKTGYSMLEAMRARKNRKPDEKKKTVQTIPITEVFEPLSTDAGKRVKADYQTTSLYDGIAQMKRIVPLKRPNGKEFSWVQPHTIVKPNMSVVTLLANRREGKLRQEFIDAVAAQVVTNGFPSGVMKRLKDQMPHASPFINKRLEAEIDRYLDKGDKKVPPTAVLTAILALHLRQVLPLDVDYLNYLANDLAQMQKMGMGTLDEIKGTLLEVIMAQEYVVGASLGLPKSAEKQHAVFGENEATMESFVAAARLLHQITHFEPEEFVSLIKAQIRADQLSWTSMLKRKLDRYERKKVGRRIRPYYVPPAWIKMALTPITVNILKTVLTFQKDPKSGSALGFSWFHEGGDQFYDVLTKEASEWVNVERKFGDTVMRVRLGGVVYSDDGAFWIVFERGDERWKYYYFPDMNAHDMHCSKEPITAFRDYLLRQMPEEVKNSLKNAFTVLSYLAMGGYVVLGGTHFAFKQSGLNSGVNATTLFGIVEHVSAYRLLSGPLISEFVRLKGDPSKEWLGATLRKVFSEHSPMRIKDVHVVSASEAEERGVLPPFLGMSLTRDDGHWYPVPASGKIPVRLAQPLSRTDAKQYMTRASGLALCGGWFREEDYADCLAVHQHFVAASAGRGALPTKGEDIVLTPGFEEVTDLLRKNPDTLPSRDYIRAMYHSIDLKLPETKEAGGVDLSQYITNEPIVEVHEGKLRLLAPNKPSRSNARDTSQDLAKRMKQREKEQKVRARAERKGLSTGGKRKKKGKSRWKARSTDDYQSDDDGYVSEEDRYQDREEPRERELTREEQEDQDRHDALYDSDELDDFLK